MRSLHYHHHHSPSPPSFTTTIRFLPFPQQIGSAADKLTAETATQTVARLTITASELDESLGVGSIEAGHTCLRPSTDNAVRLWRQRLPHTLGTLAERVVALVAAIGKEHGNHTVDHDETLRTERERLVAATRWRRIKRVVSVPIVGGTSEQELLHGRRVDAVDETGEGETLLVVEDRQLGDADMREVLRTQPQELPLLDRYGCERELLPQIAVFPLQRQRIVVVERAFEQTSLTEEYGLHLKEVVTMLRHGSHGDGVSP